jgi:hypothetical protein
MFSKLNKFPLPGKIVSAHFRRNRRHPGRSPQPPRNEPVSLLVAEDPGGADGAPDGVNKQAAVGLGQERPGEEILG